MLSGILKIVSGDKQDQITLKENALETSCNAFLEKEKDLQNKIEELEARLEELNQNTFCKFLSAKVSIWEINIVP